MNKDLAENNDNVMKQVQFESQEQYQRVQDVEAQLLNKVNEVKKHASDQKIELNRSFEMNIQD